MSSLIVSPEPILYTGLDHPDLVVLLSQDGAERYGELSELPKSSWVAINKELPVGPTSAKVIQLPSLV